MISFLTVVRHMLCHWPRVPLPFAFSFRRTHWRGAADWSTYNLSTIIFSSYWRRAVVKAA